MSVIKTSAEIRGDSNVNALVSKYFKSDVVKDIIRRQPLYDLIEPLSTDAIFKLVTAGAVATKYVVRFYSPEGKDVYDNYSKEEFKKYIDLIIVNKSFAKAFLVDLYMAQQDVMSDIMSKRKVVDMSEFAAELRNLKDSLPSERDDMKEFTTKLGELGAKLDSLSVKAEPGITPEVEASIGRSEEPKYVKLDSQLPLLKGTLEEDIDDWFFTIENYSKTRNIKDERKLLVFTPLFRGNALQIVKSMAREDNSSWAEFQRRMRQMHNPFSRQRQLRQKLRDCKLRNNFDEFIHNFRSIVNQIEGLPEKEIVFIFLDALTPKLRSEVLAKGSDTFEDAIRVASAFEDCYQEPTSSNYVRKVNYSKQFMQRNTGWDDQRKNEPSRNHQNKICYRCRKEGHIARDCYDKEPKQVNTVIEEERLERIFTCQTGSDSLIGTFGLVNENATTFCFDSGATSSVLSTNTANKIGIKILPSRTKVVLADNSTKYVVGKTERLTVDIQGRSCELSFLVMDHEDYDAILGLDWFTQTGAGIYPSEKNS